jgi:hypothetical protein
MKIRWYQHRTQGGSSMTSLKKRAPSVDPVAITQQPKRSAQAESGERSSAFTADRPSEATGRG